MFACMFTFIHLVFIFNTMKLASVRECMFVAVSCGVGQEQAPGSDICQPCQADYIKDASGPGRCTQCTGNSTANAARTVCNVCTQPAVSYSTSSFVSFHYLGHWVFVSKLTENKQYSIRLNLSFLRNVAFVHIINGLTLHCSCKCFVWLM